MLNEAKIRAMVAHTVAGSSWRIMLDEIDRLRTIADALLNHCDKQGGECSECAMIVCPEQDGMHFHHDGCPSCSQLLPSGTVPSAEIAAGSAEAGHSQSDAEVRHDD